MAGNAVRTEVREDVLDLEALAEVDEEGLDLLRMPSASPVADSAATGGSPADGHAIRFCPGRPLLSFCPKSTASRAFSIFSVYSSYEHIGELLTGFAILTQIGRIFRIPSDYALRLGAPVRTKLTHETRKPNK